MNGGLPAEIGGFLGEATPASWVEAAAGSIPVLAVDHANCEKKAAATAISLMNRYPSRESLVQQMSRLAREELRHFEQVTRLMRAAGIPWRHVSASRYAAGLRRLVSQREPDRLTDTLLIGAFIEARSCERFALLAPVVGEPFAGFYRGLLASEARHYARYLALAREHLEEGADEIERRADRIREEENRLATQPDGEIRFHSGPPI